MIRNGIRTAFSSFAHSRMPTVAGTNIMDMVSIRKLPVPSTLSIFTTPDIRAASIRKRPYTPAGTGRGRIWFKKFSSQSDTQDNTDLSYVFHLCFPPDVLADDNIFSFASVKFFWIILPLRFFHIQEIMPEIHKKYNPGI